jgi:signal transduction histidine kinase/ActR/RegA family two-component response regulator
LQGCDSSCGHCQELSNRENRYDTHHWDYYNKVVDRYFHAIDRLIQWPDGREVRFHLAIDTTSQKRAEKEKAALEQQINHAQKMESVGRLAGGMAHDLNNLLTPILCYGELLSTGLSHDEELHESAEEILKAGLRARDLVQQLLAFSRKQVLRFETLDLNREVNALVRLLRRTIPENVDIIIHLHPEPLLLRGDSAQIEQVLMNLVVNAWDAMPDGGGLTIETRLTELNQEYAESHQEVGPGKYAILEVSDSGTGMSPETRSKIFEPFFSTKEKGKGTGLGLATTYGIVKQHGGHIWVYSELNRGTSFKIYFPVISVSGEEQVENNNSSEQSFVAEKSSATAQKETILLVEDSDTVRKLAADVLTKAGYNILVAENGLQALSMLGNGGEKIDLLLTDVIMPRMNGRQLFFALQPLYPDLKVIYMSGYTENVIAQHGVLDEGMFFIQKPFSVKILSDTVRKVLEQKT